MTRYVIVGAGAVGACFAAEFTAAGIPTLLVGRGETISRIAADGLVYRRPSGTSVVSLATASSSGEVALAAGDVIVLATKAQHVEAAVREWAWLPVAGGGVAADLPVVTLQNGLDSERVALRRFGLVIAASLRIPAKFVEPGVVVSASADPVSVIFLGRFPGGSDPRVEAVAADLRRAHHAVQVTEDIVGWKVEKLRRSVKNGLEAFGGSDEERRRAEALVEGETDAVIAAAGLLPATAEQQTVDVTGYGPVPGAGYDTGQQSTWQSLVRGAGSVETDFLNGEVVLLGRLHGVPTPANAAVQRLLGAAASAHEPPGARSLAEVLRLAEDLAG